MIWYLLNLNVLTTDESSTDVSVAPPDIKTNEGSIQTKDILKDNDSNVLSQSVSENDEGVSNKRKITIVDEDQSSESYKRAKLFEKLLIKKRCFKLQEKSDLNESRHFNDCSIEKPSYFKGIKKEDIETLSDCVVKLTSDEYDINDWNVIYKIIYGEEKNISLLPSKEYSCIFKFSYYADSFYKKKMKNIDPFLVSNKRQEMNFYECFLFKIIRVFLKNCDLVGLKNNCNN
ncbi:hypothetical protein A0H76_1911 [Hepatospora eriocheir]|uniref:Uncharacterized protein n=1 Tax=Hepatospora eriocheir TaxID=1081669 RepID=A0A1X0QG87_9MICR|nr:hypothetical protein A0H76_1911 [Hepatospora eriocheir]